MGRTKVKKRLLLPYILLGVFTLYSFSLVTKTEEGPDKRQEIKTPMQSRLRFEHITIEDGLSQNSIFCILLDSRGFLWIGTESGLNRYDGYGFDVYEHKSDNAGSLSGNNILCMCEDRSGNLWIGTNNGLNKFNRDTETFIRFRYKGRGTDISDHNYISSLYEDSDRFLWIGTQKGLKKIDKENKTLTNISLTPENPDRLSDEWITVIVEDSKKVLWFGSQNGLWKFDREEKLLRMYRCYPEETVKNKVKTICEDRSGMLWVGTDGGGLHRFDREKEQFKTYRYNPGKYPNCPASDNVHSIIEDSQSGDLWIGTLGGGLNRFDPGTGTFTLYKEDLSISTALSSNEIYTVYQDNSGLIWVGTKIGLNKLDKRKNEFVHWTAEPQNIASLSHKYVWSFCMDSSGILWVGTDKGLDKFNSDSGTFTHYKHNPDNPLSLSKGNVTAIGEDHAGTLWVGTVPGGLNKFDRGTVTFTRYTHNPDKRGTLSDNNVSSILVDRVGVLWIGTNDGLNRFDKKNEKFTGYKPDKSNPGHLSHERVTCLFEDKAGVLWIGTEGGGLNRFDQQAEIFTWYKHDPSNSNSLSSDNVACIYEDKAGILWIGTYDNGLNKFARETKTFTHYRNEEGKQNSLPNDGVFGILEDKAGNLWISTYKGISKFSPDKKTFRNYDRRDGLQSNEFNGGAFFKASNGEMFFGGTNGFNRFYPHRIIDNPHCPRIVFTDFQIFNKPPKKNQLRKSIIETKEIVLTHRDYVFSFEFAALDFSTPDKNRYKYKMSKVDRDWVEGDAAKRFVTYTKLDPGTYTFRVLGSNNDGRWSKEGASIEIFITPPFTETWWFRIILGIAFILAIFGGYRARTRYLRGKLAEQQRVQKILKQSRDEMEKARDLAEIRHAENEKLLTAISAIFIAVDSDGLIFQWNKPAEEFFRICEDDVVKKPFVEVCKTFIGEEKLNEIIEKGLKQEPDKSSAKMIEISVDLKTRGKGIKLLVCSVSPIMDRSGKKLGFLLVAEDVTNRKEEEMLRNFSKKLESLGQMASGIAHEIKTPLQYIGDNARFVGDSFRDVVNFYKLVIDSLPEIENSGKKEIAARIKERSEEYDMEYIMEEIPTASEQIIDGVSRVSGIIKAMTEFSHPGRGVKEKADINGLLNSTLVMVKNRIKKSADIRLELAVELPPIACFPAELNQVFLNLLVNALDAIVETGKWGVIRISTTVEENEAVISISDTGCGIPEENRDDIFNPFFTTKEVGKGTGQGLSLARNIIIEKHKGKMDFTTKPGEGTTFYIRLPMEGEH